MAVTFYIAAAVAAAATLAVITRRNAVHALLYLIVSLLAVSLIFFILGAPFAAALEAIIYAGAIMVLFIFVIMILNLGPEAARLEQKWLRPRMWTGPAALSLILIGELGYILWTGATGAEMGAAEVGAKPVGIALFGPYLLAVELASLLLLAGLVGAYHLGRRESVLAGGMQTEGGAEASTRANDPGAGGDGRGSLGAEEGS